MPRWATPGLAIRLWLVYPQGSLDMKGAGVSWGTRGSTSARWREGLPIAPNIPSCTILIVDDDPDDVFFSTRALRAAGFTNAIRVANNGEVAMNVLFGDQARGLAPAERIGLVLLDKRMPRLEGEALLRRTEAEPRLAAIPVIMLTGLADPALVVRVEAAGALACLQKPLDAEELRAVLRSLPGETLCPSEPS